MIVRMRASVSRGHASTRSNSVGRIRKTRATTALSDWKIARRKWEQSSRTFCRCSNRAGLDDLGPQPYWGFDDLTHKAGSKLANCFYVGAETKRVAGKEFFHYSEILMMQEFGLETLLKGLEEGWAFVDFDARSGHNHGTKFRIRQDLFPVSIGTRQSGSNTKSEHYLRLISLPLLRWAANQSKLRPVSSRIKRTAAM
jgi:hypothetical protein